MHFFSTKRRCESIFEVIIAITVISIGTSAITLLITTVMQANALSKQFIIANNLAAEGLEAVSNIRESNWIEFPGYETDCWNVMPTVTVATDCTKNTTTNKIGGSSAGVKYFVPTLDTTYGWTLAKETNALTSDLSKPSKDNPYSLSINDTNGIYSAPAPATTGTETLLAGTFYRMITIEYYDDLDSSTRTIVKPINATYMDVTSTVEWKDKLSNVHTVTKTTRLFNHVSS